MAKLPMPFGNPATYAGHSGVDYPQARGTVFRASGHGRVRNIGKNARGGNYIWVKYDGIPAVGYHHMDTPTTLVRVGQEVWEGTPLGRVGSLGQFSTGPHLHSEVEGYGTTAGYWQFFDRNRVVGQASPAGGGSTTPGNEEDDMPTIGEIFNTPVTKGPDGNDISLAQFMGFSHLWDAQAVWEHTLKHTISGAATSAGDLLRYEPAEHAADRAASKVTDAQVKAIADAVVKAVGTPTATVDYARIAKEVNDVADQRSLARYTK